MGQQLTLPLKTWGGRRPGAGRPRVRPRPGVPHRSRPELSPRFPVHVTIRLRSGLPTLRSHRVAAVVLRCLAATSERPETRLIHYSIQRDHLHLLMEVADGRSLARACKGLSIRLAKNLNRLVAARDRVVADRYDVHILRTPLEVKRALVYVLQNARKHLQKRRVEVLWDVDPFSSARAFNGWSRPIERSGPQPPVVPAQTWLLAVGWRRHGLVSPDEAPALA